MKPNFTAVSRLVFYLCNCNETLELHDRVSMVVRENIVCVLILEGHFEGDIHSFCLALTDFCENNLPTFHFAFTQPIHSHGSVRIIYDFLFLLLIYFRHKLCKSLLACYCGCRWRCTKPCSKSCPRSLFSFLVVVIFSRVTKSPAVR